MKTADLKVGMEVAIGPPSMWGIKWAIVLGFGWENGWAGRGYRFHRTRDGKGGIAVAVLTSMRFGNSPEIWEPDVCRAQQIRGPWAEVKAQRDAQDEAARLSRLREAERHDAWTARLDAIEDRLSAFEGEVVTLRSSGDRVLVPIDILERLLAALADNRDVIAQLLADVQSLTGVR